MNGVERVEILEQSRATVRQLSNSVRELRFQIENSQRAVAASQAVLRDLRRNNTTNVLRES